MSARQSGSDVDVQIVNGEGEGDGGVKHGRALCDFAEALASRDETRLEQTRSALIEKIGVEGMQAAAAVAANFQRMVRIADATGIPVDAPMNAMSQDLQRQLGLDRFHSAKNTPALSFGLRLLSPVLGRIAPFMIRRIAKQRMPSD